MNPTQRTARTGKRRLKAAGQTARAGRSRNASALLRLRSLGGLVVEIDADARLGQRAYFWNYVVRNRQRYSAESQNELRAESQRHLAEMGVSREALEKFAAHGFVEVSIPYTEEASGWEARIMPWESILSLATKQWRRDRRLVVIRRLERQPTEPPTVDIGARGTLLFVASAPGRLAKEFSFENEYRLVTAALSVSGTDRSRIDDPTLAELAQKIGTAHPAVIHLSGVDAHQAATFFDDWESGEDGFLLPDAARQPESVGAVRLSETLTAKGAHRPQLVAFNCYYSAARLAPMAVASGARLSIGFQDTIDDTLAEQFFAEFYTSWRSAGDPLRAFAQARLAISASHPTPQNGDVVLWSDSSLVPPDTQSFYAWLQQPPTAAQPPTTERAIETATEPAAGPVPIFVTAQVRERLNYSLLHNNASLFRTFKIQKSTDTVTPEVDILVELYVGEVTFPYRAVCCLEKLLTDYSDQIRVPLVAGVLRGRRESIQTSIFIEVKEGQRTIHRSTQRVTLLPADEWTDDPTEWQWLPSFVLPRDRAIASILTHAERYLRALADDSTTGFDGYQRLEEDGSNPEVVDLQVRATWAALVHETPLTYINPPPTYTQNSQRLRTPSMILEERRGTCIDLAVLFAACLEYIGLLPVIFLIKGHAFPGYWRRPVDQATLRNFGNVAPPAAMPADAEQNVSGPIAQRIPWVFAGVEAFREIAGAINSGGLVPVETVQLTRRGAFSDALELGVKNLATGWSFDALVDVQIARDAGVTPLPLFEDQL